MTVVDYFKLQAKNLMKDYKTQYIAEGDDIYSYKPKYFDIDGIFLDYDTNENDFSLMKAQHLLAEMVGFKSWHDLVNGTTAALEFAKLRFDSSANENLDLDWYDYRLPSQEVPVIAKNIFKPQSDILITSLPLSRADFAEFVRVANHVFESVLARMEPKNPEIMRKLWNAERYVEGMLVENMLPISKDYALSLIDAFLVHDVLDLVSDADKLAALDHVRANSEH